MDKLEVKENSLIICPTSYKTKILEQMYQEKIIIDTKFMDLSEFRKNWYFDYDEKALKYLVDQGLSVSNSQEILENLYYVEDKKYNEERLDTLLDYKRELDEKGLLIYNPIFKDYVKTKNIVVLGYGKLNNFDTKMLGSFAYVEENNSKDNYKIFEFKDIEHEVEYVYNSISDLLDKGIDINNIYILNASSDYSSYFKRYNQYYQFNVEIKEEDSLYGIKLAEQFINDIDNKTKEEIYEDLINLNDENTNKIINIINKYAAFDLKDVKPLIIADLKNTSIYKESLTNVVKCVDGNSLFGNNDYIFLVGFNDNYPNLKKDVDYITDSIRPLVNLDSVETENIRIKENTKNYLASIKNLTLSYSQNSPFSKYNKQTLFDNVEYPTYQESYEYSDKLNKKKYAENLDKLLKYGVKDTETLAKLYYLYKDNDYLTYNNKFSKLTSNEIKELENVTLSYSSMNSFYLCKFKYYVENILKITSNEGTFDTKIGSLCHHVLEKYYDDASFELDSCWNNYINEYEQKNACSLFADEKEEFFANKIKEELKEDIQIIKEQKVNSLFTSVKCEEKFEFDVTSKAKFKGFIDKLLFNQKENEVNLAVVDYKTGYSADIDTKLMEFGLSLQLPSYMYLLKKTKRFKDADLHFCGFYLQHIVNNDYKYEDAKTLEEKKQNSMKLDGFTINDIGLASNIDSTLEPGLSSSNIKSIKVKNDGDFASSPRLLTKDDIDNMIQNVEDRINEAIQAISSGDFVINPKVINAKNKSCEYCPYGNICYKRNNDLKYLSINEEN